MIDFLDELGNFKQKIFYTSKCKFFFNILKQQTHCTTITFVHTKFASSTYILYSWMLNWLDITIYFSMMVCVSLQGQYKNWLVTYKIVWKACSLLPARAATCLLILWLVETKVKKDFLPTFIMVLNSKMLIIYIKQ